MSAPEKGSLIDTALELLSHAIGAEDNHDYTGAYARYMAAIDYLMAAQQAEPNEKSRALLKMKANEYLNRAETIRPRINVGTQEGFNGQDIETADTGGLNKARTTPQSIILDEAFKCAKQAIDADISRNYAEAYRQYMKCMDYFMFAQRYEPDEQSRSLIRSEVVEYLSRAENIKKHLESFKESGAEKKTNLGIALSIALTTLLQTAIEITQRAIQQDAKQNYRSAYDLYNGALDFFMLAQKYEKNEQSKIAIRANMEEYLARAEVLKKCI